MQQIFEDQDTEKWEAWIDGQRGASVFFEAPKAGFVDIADLAARAMGVDLSEKVNVRRCSYA